MYWAQSAGGREEKTMENKVVKLECRETIANAWHQVGWRDFNEGPISILGATQFKKPNDSYTTPPSGGSLVTSSADGVVDTDGGNDKIADLDATYLIALCAYPMSARVHFCLGSRRAATNDESWRVAA
jgi:hypothetical protein